MTTYLKAKDVMTKDTTATSPLRNVERDMALVDVLPRLLDAPGRMLGVVEGDRLLGVVNEQSLLEGLGRMFAARDDCSMLSVECGVSEFSASAFAHAVEDAGAHLVDLWTVPASEDTILVTLRVRVDDPSSVMRHLERYGFSVTEASGKSFVDAETAAERLQSLRALLNV